MATSSSALAALLPLSTGFFSDTRLSALPAHDTQKYKNRDLVKYIVSFIDERTCNTLLLVNRRWRKIVMPLSRLPRLGSEEYIPAGEDHCRVRRTLHRTDVQSIAKETGLHIPFPAGNNLVNIPNLGRGAFGEFCIGQVVGKTQWIGIKIIRGEGAVDSEIMIQQALRSKPHILSALASHKAISPTGHVSLYQFMELAGLGSADKLISTLPKMDLVFQEQVLFLLAEGLFEGLKEMHETGYCHLDIKPNNFAIRQDGRVLLIDFGCSAPMRDKKLNIKKEDGDTYYFSPERWLGERFPAREICEGDKIDAWAAGLSILALTGQDVEKLFIGMRTKVYQSDAERALTRYVNEQLFSLPMFKSPAPDSYAHLLFNLLHPNPRERLTPTQALKHPWCRKMATSLEGTRARVNGYLRECVQNEQRLQSVKGFCHRSPQDLPLPHFTSFVERLELQNQIEKCLFDHSLHSYFTHAPHLVCQGVPYSGKSHLLTYLIYHPRVRTEFGLTLWFNAGDSELLAQQCMTLVREWNVVDETATKEKAIRELHDFLAKYPAREGKPWLIIFDGAKDAATLAPYLPRLGGQVIITTRSNSWKKALLIDRMVDAEAQALMEKLLMRKDPHIPDLCKALYNIPLAIAKACAHIRTYRHTVQAFTKLLRSKPTILDQNERLLGRAISTKVLNIRTHLTQKEQMKNQIF